MRRLLCWLGCHSWANNTSWLVTHRVEWFRAWRRCADCGRQATVYEYGKRPEDG